MKTYHTLMFTLLIAGVLTVAPGRAASQTEEDAIAVARSAIKADRQAVVTQALQLTATESQAFWPLYREYRAEMDKLGDGIVKLVLEYADAYPNVPEDRAEKLLKDYLALEKDLANARAKHLKKVAKVLPKSKVLRFAQLENRLDLALRLQMASAVPLAPIEGRISGEVTRGAVTAEGIVGGTLVQAHQLTATVTAIDQQKRTATLRFEDGSTRSFPVRSDVNLGKRKVGEKVVFRATEMVAIRVEKP